MNSLWGRSKSKHRKVGNLKDRIGNPTPLEPININGSFIDLKVSPQDGSVPLVGTGVLSVHQPAHSATASAGGAEANGGEYSSKLDPGPHQPSAPPGPSRADDQYRVQEYLRGNGNNDAKLANTSDEHVSEWDGNNGENQEYYPRPYSPERSGSSGRRNFSRPAVTPGPDEVGHFVVPSFSSHSSSTSSNPTVRTRNQEQSHLALKTGTSISTSTTQSPITYRPYSPASQYTARGRQPERGDLGLPTVDRFQGGNIPLAIARSTTESRRSDSSDYSSAGSIEGPLSFSQAYSQPYYQAEQPRHRQLKLDIQPARELQQAETAKYFEGNDSAPEDPISPLLPSPRRHNNPAPLNEFASPVSPVSGPTSIHSSPGRGLNLSRQEPTEPIDTAFIDFSMPSLATGAMGRPTISAPQSPDQHNLPAYLGKLQPVQRGPDFYDKPAVGVSSGPKRSLSRKVSTRLRTLVGAGNKPREETLPEEEVLTSPRELSRGEVPQLPSLDIMNSMHLDVIAGSTAPTSTSRQQIGPQMDDITTRFNIERDTQPTYQVQENHGKVDDWSYYPSAASSTSNLSLRPSFKSADNATLATDSDNPGLSSQHSSTRSSHRNITPETPATPADDGYSFSALRGHPGVGGTHKSDMTAKQQDFMQAGPTKFSEEVPVFLDTTTEASPMVPSFTHEPPTPDPHKTTFSRIQRDGNVPETGKHESVSTNVTSSTAFTTLTRPSPTISSAPTSAATSPLLSTSPLSPVCNRSPTARKPPFGPGSPRMMLRAATMSSRPKGGAPLKSKPVPPPVTDNEATSYPPSRNNSSSERSVQAEQSPTSPYARSGSAFSFLRDDFSVVRPDDIVSQSGNKSGPSSPLSRSTSPTLFDVDRSLSKSQIRPKTASRAQNDRVAALSRFDDPLPRSSTGTPVRAGLRVNTDFHPSVPANSISAVEVPRVPAAGGLAPPPVVKRSKSVGEGLKRAFSRRPPKTQLPGTMGEAPSSIPEDSADIKGGTTSPISGPLGCGTSSELSKARWNTAIRAAAVSSALNRSGSNASSRPGAMLDTVVPASSSPNRVSVIFKAQPLTAEEKKNMHHAPGTLFIRTCEEDDSGVGECKEHRMKPRKGGTMQKCAFCLKGPFANMWICLDGEDGAPEVTPENTRVGGVREREEKKGGRCAFAICRMCCNEQVQEGHAEIF